MRFHARDLLEERNRIAYDQKGRRVDDDDVGDLRQFGHDRLHPIRAQQHRWGGRRRNRGQDSKAPARDARNVDQRVANIAPVEQDGIEPDAALDSQPTGRLAAAQVAVDQNDVTAILRKRYRGFNATVVLPSPRAGLLTATLLRERSTLNDM